MNAEKKILKLFIFLIHSFIPEPAGNSTEGAPHNKYNTDVDPVGPWNFVYDKIGE